MATTKKVQLPEGFDPYDMRLKRQFSDQADKMNVIALSRKNYNLCCGAMHNGQPCKNPAGMGTPHKGYGRCKIHGGLATGPKTAEGRARQIAASTKHGLFSTVAREVILGVWGNMPERKTKLEASGYNFTDVQNKVNELLNKNVPTPSKPQNTGVTKVVAGSGAASFDKSLAGSYVTTTGLYMRHGAGKNKRAMVLIPEGTKVQNYGYYTSYNGTKWLYIQVTLNGVQYTGFSCKTYLKKQ